MKLRRNRLGGEIFSGDESVNPMDGVANLADVMLVLACGLMLALIINWNVDVSITSAKSDAPVATPALTEIESGASGEETPLDDETEYEELDVAVYRDPATGKLYMVERNE
jgi:hypothetical protein